jgi:hypothetical protein
MPSAWDRVRQFEGCTLATLHRAKPFTIVAVEDDCVRVMPRDGKGAERSVRRDRIKHVAGMGLPREEVRRRVAQEYPDSQNTSYIAALAYEATRPVPRPPATLAGLFREAPRHWGLRGDPFQWAEMAQRLGPVACPASPADLSALIEDAFAELTGQPLSYTEALFVER